MSEKHKIIFYPVGNGDTTQIILDNGKRILFDFRHKNKSEDESTLEINLKARLKRELGDAKTDAFDVVAFTHADKDHIEGSTDFFELNYAQKYQGDGRIKIKELWVPAAMILEDAGNDEQSEEFVILRQEARYRLLEGKGILVFSKPQKLLDWLIPALEKRGESAHSRDHLFIDAGTIVKGFSLEKDSVEFFCHSPFIKHCDEGDIIRNSAALVFNVRFAIGTERYDYLEIGDAHCQDLEEIVETTKKHKNDDRLEWNLLNIPHHCSYLSLNIDGQKGDAETKPTELVEELLLKGKKDAYIVSCSNEILETKAAYEQTQPPHIQAKNAYTKYLKQIGGREFLVTMEEPKPSKPEPIEFEVKSGGITLEVNSVIGRAAVISSSPPRAGLRAG